MTWNHPALAQRALDEGDKEIATLKAEVQRLRGALQRISDNRSNKNWRKPEICDEADRALALPNGDRA